MIMSLKSCTASFLMGHPRPLFHLFEFFSILQRDRDWNWDRQGRREPRQLHDIQHQYGHAPKSCNLLRSSKLHQTGLELLAPDSKLSI